MYNKYYFFSVGLLIIKLNPISIYNPNLNVPSFIYLRKMTIRKVQNRPYDLVIDIDEDIQLELLDEDVSRTEWYGDGCFEFIQPESTRNILIDAHEAITRCELWQWLANFKETSFMWSTAPELEKIACYVFQTRIGSLHSGSSFAYIMREMEKIAKYGYTAYRESNA